MLIFFDRIAGALAVVFAVSCFFTAEAFAQGVIGVVEAQAAVSESGKKNEIDFLENNDLSMFRGYQTEEIPSGWSVEDKTLIFNGVGSGDIITKDTFQDFELQVEWNVSEGGNSGIMFRVGLGDSAPYLTGPEFQILDDAKHADKASELTAAGALYGLYPAERKKVRDAGKWNSSRIVVEGNKVTHYLNDSRVVVAEIGSDDWNQRLAKSKFKDWEKFATLESGHIAFQNHGDPVKFRRIRIKTSESTATSSGPGGRDGAPVKGMPPLSDGMKTPPRGGIR